jgi:hypothetical protein
MLGESGFYVLVFVSRQPSCLSVEYSVQVHMRVDIQLLIEFSKSEQSLPTASLQMSGVKVHYMTKTNHCHSASLHLVDAGLKWLLISPQGPTDPKVGSRSECR